MASRVGLIAFAVQVFFTCGLTAQTGLLQLAEYFWDVDPGAGNAIALSAQDGGFDEAIENILLNTQELPTAGLHTLGVRMQDGTGSWGSVFQVNIFIDENGSELRQINISAAEYFWDNDPGEGAATPMVVADGNFEEAIEAAMFSTSTFPGFGPHTLGIRVLDAEGAWSATFSTVVQIDEPSTDLRQINIQSAEYFWNNDPGEGSGTPMIVFDGNFDDAIESISLSTSSFPADGPQVLNIRVMDAEGVWSVAFSTVIFIDEPSTALRDIEITAAEYFWNSDPGQGNGNTLIAFDGNFDEALETATMSTGSFPETGPQLLNIRILDAEGAWSPVFSTMVVIDEPSTALREILVTSAELFWDADPGIGNGIPMVAFDSDFDEALEQAYKCTTTFPGPGAHKISFRMRGADQQWSPAFSAVIVIDEPNTALREISLASAEYFWDADPGTGNGNPMFVIDGNFNEAIESVSATATIGLTEGVHVLNVRMKSIEGIWSSLFKAVVVIDEQSEEQRDIYVASAEYWFDTDPGAGSGTPIITEDGAFDDAIEIIKGADIPVPVTEGMHTLWFRAKDPQGGWGSKFGIVVYMDIDVNGFTTAISGAESICAGIDQIGQHYYALGAEGSTYAWTINGGLITGGQGTAHVTVNWNSGTGQWLSLQQCLDGVCQDDILYVNFLAPVFNTVNVSICEGESYFAANAYRTESGTYVDEFQTVLGCDSTVTTYLTVLPHTSSTSYVSICQGESWNAGGANQTTSGTYLDTYQASNGCDSLHYTVLTVHPTYNEQKYVEICPGSSYFAGGNWQ
ncbi:MAG: hypothetical protein JNM00_03280, partial [Flavobacteriales bacterium]|nr:hypothetical protein [Flavobacteriales bacterium]